MGVTNIQRFNIHPGKGTWVTCYIWETLEDMHNFVATQHPDWNRDYSACYLGNAWEFNNGIELKTRKLAELHFANGEFGAGIFAHELQHFLVDWIKKMGWSRGLYKKYWEDIAHLAGHLTSEFWTEYYERYD